MAAPNDHAAQIAERYDRRAEAYRTWWAPVLRQAGLVLVNALGDARPRVVVDVGAGVGTLLPDLATAFPDAEVVAVDRSRGMLALAPATFPRGVMDATRLALRSASADLVLAVFMLFHLERPVEGLREARRVLRPGGRFGAVTWGGELESAATRVWSDCLDAHGAAPVDPAGLAHDALFDQPEKMEGMLREAGFGAVHAWQVELRCSIDLEHLVQLRTQLGSMKPRFDSLSPGAQGDCVVAARARLTTLGPEDFVARCGIVLSGGTA